MRLNWKKVVILDARTNEVTSPAFRSLSVIFKVFSVLEYQRKLGDDYSSDELHKAMP
jgi:hypothetical protein